MTSHGRGATTVFRLPATSWSRLQHRPGGDLHRQREQQGSERRPPRSPSALRRAKPPTSAAGSRGSPAPRGRPGGTGRRQAWRHCRGTSARRDDRRTAQRCAGYEVPVQGGVTPRDASGRRSWSRSGPVRHLRRPARLGRTVRRAVHGRGVSARHAVSAARRVDPPGRLSPGNQGFPAARDRLTLAAGSITARSQTGHGPQPPMRSDPTPEGRPAGPVDPEGKVVARHRSPQGRRTHLGLPLPPARGGSGSRWWRSRRRLRVRRRLVGAASDRSRPRRWRARRGGPGRPDPTRFRSRPTARTCSSSACRSS